MNAKDLLAQYRFCKDHFNRREYPELFERIKKDIEAFLSELPSDEYDSLLQDAASEILDEVEANQKKYKYKFRQKTALADDHLVLSLFVVPAAAHIGTPLAQRFAELISETFTERFKGTTFLIGDYDKIMDGFRWKVKLFSLI